MTRTGLSIVWDGFWFVAGPPSQRHVVRETIATWAAAFPQDALTIVVRDKHLEQALDEAPKGASVVPSKLWPQALLATRACPAVAAARSADVVYTQNFAARTRRCTSAVFIHDVLYEDHPEWFTRRELAYFKAMPALAPRADQIFTSSRTEARRIVNHTNVDESRVAAVGIGFSEELRSASVDPSPARNLGLQPQKFLLSVGRLNVRKNLATLLEAVSQGAGVSSAFPLVVIGAPNGRDDDLSDRAAGLVESGAVVFTGHVSDGALRWFYENCRLFVFPSLGEGYGMPPVEAAAFGAPVLVSDLPVFRETLDGWPATFVDSSDAAAIRTAIADLIATPVDPVSVLRPPEWSTVVAETRATLMRSR